MSMISSNFPNTDKKLTEEARNKLEGLHLTFFSNLYHEENTIITFTLHLLRNIRKGYFETEDEIFKKFITDENKFNNKVQKVIKYSPPIINPYLLNVPTDNLKEEIINLYTEIIPIKEIDDGYLIDDFGDIKYFKSDYDFINMFKENIVSPYEHYKSLLLPLDVVAKVENMIDEKDNITLLNTGSLHIEGSLDSYEFILLYYYYYFLLLFDVFLKESAEEIYKLTNLSFVVNDKTTGIAYKEIKDKEILGTTYGEIIKTMYYSYRTREFYETVSPELLDTELENIRITFDKNEGIKRIEKDYLYSCIRSNTDEDYKSYNRRKVNTINRILTDLNSLDYEKFKDSFKKITGKEEVTPNIGLSKEVLDLLHEVIDKISYETYNKNSYQGFIDRRFNHLNNISILEDHYNFKEEQDE